MYNNPEPLFLVNLGTLALSESNQPARIPIATLGTFHKGSQKFTISRADAATMAANFAKRGNGEVVIDYEHASEQPEVAGGGPVPAAGWITSIDPDPDPSRVVWGEAQFTSRARHMIAAGEYKYGSPSLNWASRDKSTGQPQGLTLTSFALTNRPVLERMPAIRLSDAFREDEERGQANMAAQQNGVQVEIEQIVMRLSERARELMKEKSVPYEVGYKQAAGEQPGTIKRYRNLMERQRRGGIGGE